MKNPIFAAMSLACLLWLPIAVAVRNTDKTLANEPSPTGKNTPEESDQSFQEPIEYVFEKIQKYDLVMIGERHWVREEPTFVQSLIRRCFEKNSINVVFLELGDFEDQGKIDAFMASAKYDPKPVIDALRNHGELGWGYQEYFDIFKLVYDENRKKPPSQKIRLVLVNPELKDLDFDAVFYDCLKLSPMPEKQKWQMVTWLRESIKGRDEFMSAVIEAHVFGAGLRGIYYAGGSHVRKDLQKKGYRRQFFSTGGILARKYPGRVCCLTFHKKPESWQSATDFSSLEALYKTCGRSFALDTNDPRINHLRLKGDIAQKGVMLNEAYDGYIMLNLNNDYQSCPLIPGFYDDEFAKAVWDEFRKRGWLEKLPPELSQWKNKTPTGEELTRMVEEYGLR
jgi:hypothetical protein